MAMRGLLGSENFIFMKAVFTMMMCMRSEREGTFASEICGQVIDKTLKSPGYPSANYPKKLDCIYVVPIPSGMAMNVSFEDFYIEYDSTCEYDRVMIANEENHDYGMYCGDRTGHTVLVSGKYVLITFHTDGETQERGFRLLLTAFPIRNRTTNQPSPSGCGKVVNDTLMSPSYPANYRANQDCIYLVPIPQGTTMNISFHDFDVEDDDLCSFDYLEFTNEKNDKIGKYCGQISDPGRTVLVTGKYAILIFHSDSSGQRRGFLLFLKAIPQVPPMVFVPASVVRSLPGYEVTCSATGSPPIYLALMRDNAVLVNTTTPARVRLYMEGNYTCVATSRYGTNISNFVLKFVDCEHNCRHSWEGRTFGNSLYCQGLVSPEISMKCTTTVTEKMSMENTGNFSHPSPSILSGLYNLHWVLVYKARLKYTMLTTVIT